MGLHARRFLHGSGQSTLHSKARRCALTRHGFVLFELLTGGSPCSDALFGCANHRMCNITVGLGSLHRLTHRARYGHFSSVQAWAHCFRCFRRFTQKTQFKKLGRSLLQAMAALRSCCHQCFTPCKLQAASTRPPYSPSLFNTSEN